MERPLTPPVTAPDVRALRPSPAVDARLSTGQEARARSIREPLSADPSASQASAANPSNPEELSERITQAKVSVISTDGLEPIKLVFDIDKDTGQIVRSVLDPETRKVMMQWPTEKQLEFAKRIQAYSAKVVDFRA